MQISEITRFLESLAPISTQESYDNSGLIVGNPTQEVTQVLISLDCIEAVVDEAIAKKCQLIISHHPIVFRGLKRLNGSDYIERTIIKAIKNDIAIYAIHTNLDNYQFGVNYEIGKRLNLEGLSVLQPKKESLSKIACYIPKEHVKSVSESMFQAGAGTIGNYSECGFGTSGMGTFRPNDAANPFLGEKNQLEFVDEVKFEAVCPNHLVRKVVSAMKTAHPYEEVAYEVYAMQNENPHLGSGMVGTLKEPMESMEFLKFLKETFHCGVIRHTSIQKSHVEKIAFCGGSGSFLLPAAKNSGADVFVTGDYKYHEFFDAEDALMIADIGHFESEQFTSHRIAQLLTEKFANFAVHLTEVNTNPINYF